MHFDRLFVWLATGFGAGWLPKAPGTWGSALAVPLFYLLALAHPLAPLSVTLLGLLGGIPLCTGTARLLGKARDPGAIVWDEIVGQWVVLLAVPPSPGNWLLGFLLFRLFDTTKPWPLRRLEQLPGGLGIMADDLAAAAAAAAVLWASLQIFPDATGL
ncbi:MAG: phosphatidylglycerophosphatase A [Planctomycetaceae bacterium]